MAALATKWSQFHRKNSKTKMVGEGGGGTFGRVKTGLGECYQNEMSNPVATVKGTNLISSLS